MAPTPPDYKELKAIADWVNVTDDIRDFSLRVGDISLSISRNQTVAERPPLAPVAAPAKLAAAAPEPAPVRPQAEVAAAEDEVVVRAPMVGTFYASPKPGQPAFVAAGDRVSPSTVLCIVEVMKLMNNIEAGVEGTVARILVQNEQAVQYGQPLFVIKRN